VEIRSRAAEIGRRLKEVGQPSKKEKQSSPNLSFWVSRLADRVAKKIGGKTISKIFKAVQANKLDTMSIFLKFGYVFLNRKRIFSS